MATPRTTIDALPEQTAVVDTNLLVVQDGTTTKKMTVGRLTTQSAGPVDAHIANPTGAHAASAISAAPSTAPMTGADVQAQLGQAASALAAANGAAAATQVNLDAHIADPSDAHDASAISLVPSPAPFDQVDVQAWVTQVSSSVALAGTLLDHINDTIDAHDASAISFAPSVGLVSTDVQAAIVELKGLIQALDVRVATLESA